jgi:hypothetical protein
VHHAREMVLELVPGDDLVVGAVPVGAGLGRVGSKINPKLKI